MNDKNLIFYKLISPYEGDYTKNSALSPQDADSNFLHLKNADIKNMIWDDESHSLVLERMNGEKIIVNNIISNDNYEFTYDSNKGELTILINNKEFIVSGFVTQNDLNKVSTDYTINGDGSINNPLKISNSIRTGQYRPVKKLIDVVNGETLPLGCENKKGDRYLTLENTNPFGLLYNFNGVSQIQEDLLNNNSEWRIPTKYDWDDMLDSIEPNMEYRNHSNASSNRNLGQFAGKFLKSMDWWLLEGVVPPCPCEGNSNNCNDYIDTTGCIDTTENPNKGIDKYGFTILPSGYGDGCLAMDYFKMRSSFWTSTQINTSDIYTKRFDYNRSTVYQELSGHYSQYSLRLIKDYNGQNYQEREPILGENYDTIMLPSLINKPKIWTKVNINFNNSKYCGVKPNNGQELVTYNKYYINEWDGCNWVRLELVEGDCIVINEGPLNTLNHEWRVIKDNDNCIIEDVQKIVLEFIDDTYSERFNDLDNKITNEINRSISVDESLNLRFDNYTSTLDLLTLLEQYYTKTEIDEKINSRVKDIVSSSQSINVDNSGEDIVLSLNIDNVTSGNIILIDGDNGLKANVNLDEYVENTELQDIVNTLNSKINNNTSNILSEQNRALNAESVLEDKIDNLNTVVSNFGDFGEY